MNEYVTIGREKLVELCVKRLVASGVPEDEAEMISRSLVQADQRGVFSHGCVCMPRYVGLIRDGSMLPKESHSVIRSLGVVEVWDGRRSSGQVLGHRAMMRAVEMAQTGGVGVVAVKSANHFGAGAYYAMLAQQAGMIGIAASTGSPTMAPWGGADKRIGNNPVAIAVPAREHPPVVLDMAQSVVAFGKVSNMKKQGLTEVPAGWCFDRNGVETTRMDEVCSVIPMAAHKGFGAAVMVDILSGVLFGGATGARADDHQQGPSMLMVALNPEAFSDPEAFYRALDERIDELKSAHLAPGVKKIYMPGEIEYDRSVQAADEITLMKEIMDDLMALPE